MDLRVGPETYEVSIETWATHNGDEISRRRWYDTIPR
jgi:hypothetical protein